MKKKNQKKKTLIQRVVGGLDEFTAPLNAQ
jgi:hypothetical protein